MIRKTTRRFLTFAAFAALAQLAGPARAQFVFTTIDVPQAKASGGGTYVEGIYGNVVVGHYFGPLLHGFYHTLGIPNFTTLDVPAGYKNGSSETEAWGISGDNIVGWYEDSVNDTGNYGFVFNIPSSNYTTFHDPATVTSGTSDTEGLGIDGTNIIGLANVSQPTEGYIEGFLTSLSGSAYDTFYYPSPERILNEGTYNITNYATYVHGISGPNVVGYWADENLVTHGFVYNINTAAFTIIPSPTGFSAPLYGIDGNNVVGYFADPNRSFNDSGFIYNLATSQYTTFHVPSAPQNTFAQAIYGNTVVGYYLDASGFTHGFAATLQFPQILAVTKGTNLILTATNGIAGSHCVFLKSTNLTLALAQWPTIASNVFNSNGVFSVTNPINPRLPSAFYEVKETP